MIPSVPNMTGYDEFKSIMTSLPVPNEFTFPDLPRLVRMYIYILFFSYLKRLFKAIIRDKRTNSCLEKGAITRKRIL